MTKTTNCQTTPLLLLILLGCSSGLIARGVAGAAAALPEPGGVRELPALTSQTIPLVNPDFEQQWDGWTPHDQEGFSIVTQPGTAHSGRACLRFDCGKQTRYVPSLRQKIPGVVSGVYVLHFWLKLDGVAAQTQQTAGVRVSIEYQLKDGQRAWPATAVFHGMADWQQQELKVYIPPTADPGSVAISAHRYGPVTSGMAYFDTFSLTYLRPPAVEAFCCIRASGGTCSPTSRRWCVCGCAGTRPRRRNRCVSKCAMRVDVR